MNKTTLDNISTVLESLNKMSALLSEIPYKGFLFNQRVTVPLLKE